MTNSIDENNSIEQIKKLCTPHNEMSSWHLSEKLFNMPRSVSGQANIETLETIKSFLGAIPFEIKGFDNDNYFSWSKPSFWSHKTASIKSCDGKLLLSTDDNLLHLLMHSCPFKGRIPKDQLINHLFLDDNPNLIPYRTSYYKENWGFCVTKEQFDIITSFDEVDINIETKLENKPVPYGECILKGNTDKEILITSYICHPSMANNELSGILLVVRLIKSLYLLKEKGVLPFTIRFLLAPETFGSIAYISENFTDLKKNTEGVIVLSCVGDGRKISLVKGRKPNKFYSCLRLCSQSVALEKNLQFSEYDFLERGADERQYASPHVSLDVGTLCNTKFSEYPEYHTSADDMKIISEEALAMTAEIVLRTIFFFNKNERILVKDPCEPMFSKFGIYPHTRNYTSTKKTVMNLLNFTAYSDGENYLSDIAEICSISDIEALEYLHLFKHNGVIN